jgi:hypothetical protein
MLQSHINFSAVQTFLNAVLTCSPENFFGVIFDNSLLIHFENFFSVFGGSADRVCGSDVIRGSLHIYDVSIHLKLSEKKTPPS